MSTRCKPSRSRRKPTSRSGCVAPREKPIAANKGQARRAFYLIAPTIALLALVVGYPIVKAIYQSFLTDPGLNKVTGIFDQGGAWNGITNYKHWLLEQCPTTDGIGHCPTGTLGLAVLRVGPGHGAASPSSRSHSKRRSAWASP